MAWVKPPASGARWNQLTARKSRADLAGVEIERFLEQVLTASPQGPQAIRQAWAPERGRLREVLAPENRDLVEKQTCWTRRSAARVAGELENRPAVFQPAGAVPRPASC